MATIELTDDNFTDHVEDDGILFVDFWASWCGPCQQFAPTYEAASEAHPDITFGSINTEEQRELSAAAGIKSIPTLMVFREKVLVFSQPGALPAGRPRPGDRGRPRPRHGRRTPPGRGAAPADGG